MRRIALGYGAGQPDSDIQFPAAFAKLRDDLLDRLVIIGRDKACAAAMRTLPRAAHWSSLARPQIKLIRKRLKLDPNSVRVESAKPGAEPRPALVVFARFTGGKMHAIVQSVGISLCFSAA
jgi:hypothetical protein